MTDSTTPDRDSVAAAIHGKYRDKLAVRLRTTGERIAAEMSRRGLVGGGGHLKDVRDAFQTHVKEFADDLTRELKELVQQSDGTLTLSDHDWARTVLRKHISGAIHGLPMAVAEAVPAAVRGLALRIGDERGWGDALLRDVDIVLDKALLRSGPSMTTPSRSEAMMDPLVNLPNRRAFDREVDEEIAQASSRGMPVALLVFDIDRFKSVNDDNGGHATGDEALKEVAARIKACCERKGVCYRIGGDEFSVMLPNHTTDEAIAVAERIRRSINESPMTSRGLTISVSIGVAVTGVHASDLDSLKHAADAAAYEAKSLGRNLVRFSGEPPPSSETKLTPQRKQPQPGGLSEAEANQIRRDHFRSGVARCPMDEARLQVTELNSFGDRTTALLVICPMCGMTADIK